MGLVDDALKAAVDAGKNTSIEADTKFSEAIKSLKEYEDYCYPHKPADVRVEATMERAKANDKSSSAVLNRLKETFTVRQELVPLLGRILIMIPIFSR